LGFQDALAPIMSEVESEDWHRRVNGALALMRLQVSEGDAAKVRDAVQKVYASLPSEVEGYRAKAQLLAAMGHLYDAGALPFLVNEAKNKELYVEVRLIAFNTAALLANKAEAQQLRQIIQAEETSADGGYRENFAQNDPILAKAAECDGSKDCWLKALKESKEKEVLRKAAYMLARYGRGDAAVVAELTERLSHSDVEVRLAAIHALDHTAVKGSSEAVTKIEKLRETEEGRSIWNLFSQEALPIQARLRARS
jgi:hypothetical protein